MEAQLSPIVTAALQQCREQGLQARAAARRGAVRGVAVAPHTHRTPARMLLQVDVVLLAYTACLITESGSLEAAAAAAPQEQQLEGAAADSIGGDTAGEQAATPLTAAADPVQRLVAAVTQPGDGAAAATACLQVSAAASSVGRARLARLGCRCMHAALLCSSTRTQLWPHNAIDAARARTGLQAAAGQGGG